MKIEETNLKGCLIIHPSIYEDERGYFFESFNQKTFETLTGINKQFVQDNQSKSSYGVLRGLHYQIGEMAQAKLVRVLKGEVLDIAVDLRKNSKTFGEHFALKLSESNKKQLYIPRGFAHGFVVLSEYCEFIYKCDNYYSKESEAGIIYNDKDLDINWQIPVEDIKVSEKDSKLDSLNKLIY